MPTPNDAVLPSAPDPRGATPAGRRWLLALVLVLITLAAYLIDPTGGGLGGALGSGFVFDDIHLVVRNPRLLEGGSALDGFTGDYYTTGQVNPATGEVRALGYYRPLAVFSTWLDHRIWGLNPFGYHLTNLLLHLGVVLLVFALFDRILDPRAVAFGAALLFAVHPAHTESVTFISGRVDVLAALFGVTSLLLLTRSWNSPLPKSGRRRSGLLPSRQVSLLLFLCALLSKEMAITLPAAVFLIEGLFSPPDRRSWRYAFRQTLPYLAVVAIYLALRIVAIGTLATRASVDRDLVAVWSHAVTVVTTYLGLLAWPPFHFNVEPTTVLPTTVDAGVILKSLLLLGLLGVGIGLARRRAQLGIALGILWTLAALVPVSQVLPVETIIGERYLYIPSIGGVLLLTCLLVALLSRVSTGTSTRTVTVAFLAPVILLALGYTASTIHRNGFWKDNLVFWKAKTELNPGSVEAWSALAIEYSLALDPIQSANAYNRALELDPDHIEALNNYAQLLLDQGLPERAMPLAMRATHLSRNYPEAYNTLANAHYSLGNMGAAVAAYKRALAMRPDFRLGWVNLGNTYLTAGVPDSAQRAYREAIRLRPERELQIQVARCYAASGHVERGMRYLYDENVVQPESAEAYLIQGTLDFASGHADAGIASVLRATNLDPDYVAAWVELGRMFATTGRPEPAQRAFVRAIEIDPNLSQAHNNLGVLAEESGSLDQALRHYRRAAEIAPDDPEVLRNLGGALIAKGQYRDALAVLDRSLARNLRDPMTFFYRGLSYKELGRPGNALADFRTAATMNPGFFDALYEAGEILRAQGREEEAKDMYRRFLRWAPDDDPRRQILDRLYPPTNER